MKSLISALLVIPTFAQINPDLILTHGKIWTVDPSNSVAEAVACRAGRILAVGRASQIEKLAGPHTRIIHLNGRLVVPGFNDAHVHFYTGGADLASVQLRDARSESEFRSRIAAFATTLPPGRWITGGNWDHESWSPPRLPARQLIDASSAGHPVFVRRLDGHMALANSEALRLAGIDRNTPDPPGGTIVRDAGGEPSGILKDAAMEPVERVIPPPSQAEIVEALRAAMRHASEYGVTSVQDMSASPEILRAYQKLLRKGQLTVRVYAHQPLSDWQRLAGIGVEHSMGGDFLKIGGLKGFADGSLGSTTALFFDPYLDAPDTSGLPATDMIPETKMLERIAGADAAGLQIAIHAIGDRANHTVLKMYEEVARQNGSRDRRFRIEHAQHLRPDDIRRFAAQKVIASMQPYHAIDDGRWAEKRIGAARAKGAYAFRSLLDAGATLAFGSDWFVAPLDPLMGIYAAATRRTLDGKHPEGWIPEQKITVAEAIRAYTMGSAYASFEEDRKGSIEPGKLADFAVLSQDILSEDPAGIREAKIDMTIVGGQVVFDRRPDLNGVIDVHVHSDPDSLPRSIDAIDAARAALSRGLRGIVLKNHFEPTASLAYIVRKEVPGIEVFGGIVLNRPVGGINPAAVERMAQVKGGYGRVVWMPTFDAENQVRESKEERPYVPVSRGGKLLPEAGAVLDIVAKRGLVLATGHSSPEENLLLIREARQRGIERIIVTHAMLPPVRMSVAAMREAAALGAYVEFVYNALIGPNKAYRIEECAAAIRSVGPEHVILSSDLGQAGNPLHADGLAAFLKALSEAGFSQAEIDRMTKTNPARLLGLER